MGIFPRRYLPLSCTSGVQEFFSLQRRRPKTELTASAHPCTSQRVKDDPIPVPAVWYLLIIKGNNHVFRRTWAKMMVVSRDSLCSTDRILPVPVSAVTHDNDVLGHGDTKHPRASHGSAWGRFHVLREAPRLIQKLESCLEHPRQIQRPPDFSHPD